ncbi:MAG: TIGR01777 family oxidoreductase, partial [Thermoanaerobaculia bacterium]
MRVLIPGGSGLVGLALAERLIHSGHRVVISSRDPARVKKVPGGVKVEAWDAASWQELVSLIDGADAVVHLVGENLAAGRWTQARKRRIRNSRVESSRAVATAFANAKSQPGVLVQASAVGYYGPRGDEEVDEEATVGEDFLAAVCRDWEEASAEVETLEVRRPVLRSGVVLSAKGGALPRMLLPFRLFVGGPVGSGRQWFPWIHLEDEVGAICFLLEHGLATGPFNLTAPTPLTNRDFSRVLGKVLRRPSAMPVPGAALRLALGEMGNL